MYWIPTVLLVVGVLSATVGLVLELREIRRARRAARFLHLPGLNEIADKLTTDTK